jgi:hypothetical protein
MKHILLLATALVAWGATATAQLAEGDTPALTNNVQFVWGTNQAAQIKALWTEDSQTKTANYNAALAQWILDTNAVPTWGTSNAVPVAPVKAVFAVWAQTWHKGKAAEDLNLADAQRQWRKAQSMAVANAAAKALFENAWALLSPAQQGVQSNLWWTTYQASQ